MPVKKQNASSTKSSKSVPPKPKAAGTRYGTLEDWRGSNGKSAKVPGVRRNALRDGR